MTETFDRARLRIELEHDEGRLRFAYKDTTGHLTIGVGWNLDVNGLPDSIIDQLLDLSIDRAKEDLDSLEPEWRDLTPDRQRVILNVAVNLGRVRFMQFHRFWSAINSYLHGDSEAALDRAALELEESLAARQTGDRYKHLAARLRANRA